MDESPAIIKSFSGERMSLCGGERDKQAKSSTQAAVRGLKWVEGGGGIGVGERGGVGEGAGRHDEV